MRQGFGEMWECNGRLACVVRYLNAVGVLSQVEDDRVGLNRLRQYPGDLGQVLSHLHHINSHTRHIYTRQHTILMTPKII